MTTYDDELVNCFTMYHKSKQKECVQQKKERKKCLLTYKLNNLSIALRRSLLFELLSSESKEPLIILRSKEDVQDLCSERPRYQPPYEEDFVFFLLLDSGARRFSDS